MNIASEILLQSVARGGEGGGVIICVRLGPLCFMLTEYKVNVRLGIQAVGHWLVASTSGHSVWDTPATDTKTRSTPFYQILYSLSEK